MEDAPPDIAATRTTYIDRYGKDAWAKAVKLANYHHRRAASEYHLTEHFSASEWLDLCARSDMRCPLRVSADCTPEGPLSPHHRIEMGQGGSNVIGNILPVCHACHAWIGLSWTEAVDCRDGWLEWQRGLCDAVKIGDEVFDKTQSRDYAMTRYVGTILPPVLMDDAPDLIKEGMHSSKQGGLVIDGNNVTHWQNALILSSCEYDPENSLAYNLEDMVIYTEEAWLAFEESWRAARQAQDERTKLHMERYERRKAKKTV